MLHIMLLSTVFCHSDCFNSNVYVLSNGWSSQYSIGRCVHIVNMWGHLIIIIYYHWPGFQFDASTMKCNMSMVFQALHPSLYLNSPLRTFSCQFPTMWSIYDAFFMRPVSTSLYLRSCSSCPRLSSSSSE